MAVFSLPGAFTPTCSSTHLPRFNELAPTFKQNGVDQVVCIAVNDPFVMEEWAKSQESDNIFMLPDGALPHSIRTRALGAIASAKTAPQLFVNGKLIGGSDAVEEWVKQRPGVR